MRWLACLVILTLSGCASEVPEVQDMPDQPDSMATNGTYKVVDIAVDHTGTIGTSVCVPPGLPLCVLIPITPSDDEEEFSLAGAEISTNLTMTWETSNPRMEQLALDLFSVEQHDNGRRAEHLDRAIGASPLALDAPWMTLAPNQTAIIVEVEPTALILGPGFVLVTTDTEVHVQGTLHFRTPA